MEAEEEEEEVCVKAKRLHLISLHHMIQRDKARADTTVCFNDLGMKAKFDKGGSILTLSHFFSTAPAASKNDAGYKSGQK
jgi:hypothetical protein